MDGWIKVYWKLKRSFAYSNGATLALWIHILLSISRKRTILHNGTILEPGQCIISISELAKWLEKHKTTVSKYLKAFESDGMITVIKRDRNGTTLSVNNWRTYQDFSTSNATNSDRNATATRPNGNRNGTQTEIPKIPKKPDTRSKGAAPKFVPPTVDEVRCYCEQRNNSVDPERFVDYYQAQGWKLANGRAMKDWRAAVRATWEKKSFDSQVGGSASDPRGNLALLDRLLEDETE